VTCAEFKVAYDPSFDARFDPGAIAGAIDHVDSCAACSEWYMRNEVEAAGTDPDAHPCVHMAYHSLHQCLEHSDARDCPDTLIIHWEGRYSLPVRNEGRSTIPIGFCPWCGVRLPRL
jgi:hypothetical protein